MTYKQFIIVLESYYWPNNDTVRLAMMAYLKDSFKEDDLLKIFGIVTKFFSKQYRCTPDICIIDKAVIEYNKLNDFPGDRIEYKNRNYYLTDLKQYKQLDDKS